MNASGGEALPERVATTGVVARLATVPSHDVRAVLAAARDAGIRLHWVDSTGVHAMAAQAMIDATPQPSVMLAAAATPSAQRSSVSDALTVRDVGGVLDSMRAPNPAITLRATRVRSPVRAVYASGGSVRAMATLAIPSAPRVRGVLLFAHPGWDAKFTTAALEESGWHVDGALSLAPKARMNIGAPTIADTSHYSAVVVLDSGVVASRVLETFLAQGGGVVIAGDALQDHALARIAGVRTNGQRTPIAGALLTDTPKRGLSTIRLIATAPAVVLERDVGAVSVLVARRGIGRVIASGYRAMWHWRMEGADASIDDHRRWWNGVVGAVAAATDTSVAGARDASTVHVWPGDAAPVADLIARLGPAVRDSAALVDSSRSMMPPTWLILTVAMCALLIEWALRRLRGAP